MSDKYLKERVDGILGHLPDEDASVMRDHQSREYARGYARAERRSEWKQNSVGWLVGGVLVALVVVVFSWSIDSMRVTGARAECAAEVSLLEKQCLDSLLGRDGAP
jgi:hypothetical protein